VQVPTQPLLRAPALAHEILAVLEKKPELALGPLQARGRQRRLAQPGRGDGERIDRIRRATLASSGSRPGQQLRRHTDDALPAGTQNTLERQRDVAAILTRPQPLLAVRARPLQQLLVPDPARLHRTLAAQLAHRRVDRGGVCVC
jgi:hypothetical protein